MSKKNLKRSLALGAMMAFVITGSAMAGQLKAGEFDTAESFKTANGLAALSGSGYCNFYIPYKSESSNELGTTGDIIYKSSEYGGHFGLFAGLSSNKVANQNLGNPNGNHLGVKHNLTVNTGGNIYLFGGCIDTGADDKYGDVATGNSVHVGSEDESKPITISAKNHIFIGGALSNDNANANVNENKAVVKNVNFDLGQSYLCVYGAEGRGGSAAENQVEMKNVTIENANIFGGFVWNKGGNAESNNVTLNNVTLGDGAECAGGYVYGCAGNANDNTVNIGGNSKVAGIVYGGYTDKGIASDNTINIGDTADVSKANLYGNNGGEGTDNTLNIKSGWTGAIGSVNNFDIINIGESANVILNNVNGCETGAVNLNGSILELGSKTKFGTIAVENNGKIAFGANGHLDVDVATGSITLTEAGKTADDLHTIDQLNTVAAKLGVSATAKETITAQVIMEQGEVKGETTGVVAYENSNNTDGYYHGYVLEDTVTEKVNTKNQALSEAGISLKLHWRSHMNDMNKRMGELRNANGENGVWTRMVRGESEYEGTKAQYNHYQLGYDEKLSVDNRWTVGAAVTFAEGDANYGYGSTDDKSTAFAIYGSKLNNDGTFVDLIARYAHLESDFEDANSGKGDYSTNGMSVSAEFGKRIEQGNGLWIEPQVELTYGTVDSAEFQLGGKTVHIGDMDSLIGRVGFSLGKDIKQGNVYARASYLYDFEGETVNTFSNASASRDFVEDLGGGWWEVGVGANINLSKATYIYADIEKTFGGEVDTNWQWNLGVRYSF